MFGGVGNDALTGGGGADSFRVDAGTDTISDLGVGGADDFRIFAGATGNATAGAAWTAAFLGTFNDGVSASVTAAGFSLSVAAAGGSVGWTLTNAGNGTAVTLTGSGFADTITGGPRHRHAERR